MEKVLEKSLEKFPVDDFKNHLEMVMNTLVESKNISILLRREDDQIFVFYQKRYSDKVNEIFEKAQREYQRRERKDTPANRRFRILWKRNRKSASTCMTRCHEDIIPHCS
jgi:hemerythrin-like domain-containing protein